MAALRPRLVFALLAYLFIVTVSNADIANVNYPYHAELDANYQLYWDFNATHITFETVVKTTGYVALGISGNGRMYPADVVIGWVKDGVPHFVDAHTVGHVAPVVDTHQDWYLQSSSEAAGITTLQFSRKLETCDDQDTPIQDGTTRVIFSYHPDDPSDDQSIMYHGPVRKGTQSLLLLDPPSSDSKDKPLPASVKTIDILNKNFSVPGKDTYYHCTTLLLPDLGGKHHMIRYEPVVQKGHENLVHHIVLKYCTSPKPAYLVGAGYSCFDATPPQLADCYTQILVWAIGGQAFDFPDNVGYPFGTDDDAKFLILETHYDNPAMRTDWMDNSGLRLFLTPELRQHDAGTMNLGLLNTDHLIIPPYTKETWSVGYCPAECLASGLGDQEIHVFANMLHSHLLGYAIRTRVVREGIELPPLAEDNNYDFNYQEMRKLKNEYIIKKGDSIIVECLYKSPHKNVTTIGGYGTRNEMCNSIPMYYPRVPLALCSSQPEYQPPSPFQASTPLAYFNSLDWTQQSNHDMFQKMTKEADVKVMCLQSNAATSTFEWWNNIYTTYNQSSLQPTVEYQPPKACP